MLTALTSTNVLQNLHMIALRIPKLSVLTPPDPINAETVPPVILETALNVRNRGIATRIRVLQQLNALNMNPHACVHLNILEMDLKKDRDANTTITTSVHYRAKMEGLVGLVYFCDRGEFLRNWDL